MKIMNAPYFEGEWCEGTVSILIYQREKSADFSLWLCAPGERTFYRVKVPKSPGSGKT